MLKGIDLSYAQTTTPPLDGFDFVIVKASQENYADPMWLAHSKAVRAAGLPLIAYHYLKPAAYTPISVQAARFLATARTADYLFLDEEGAATDAEAQQFLDIVRKVRECGLYHSSCGFGGTTEDAQWVADYRNPGLTGPQKCDLSGLFPGWDIWQYTSKGTIAGYVGDLDLNYMNPASPLVARLRVGYRDPAPLQGVIDRLQSEDDALRAEIATKVTTIKANEAEITALQVELADAAGTIAHDLAFEADQQKAMDLLRVQRDAAPGIERARIAAAEAARLEAL